MKKQGTDESYSSPLLVINLYKDTDTLNQSVGIAGFVHEQQRTIQVDHNNRKEVTERYVTCTERQLIIPVEDVIAIRYSSQFRKSRTHVESESVVQEAKYEGVFSRKKMVDVVHKSTVDSKDAKRLITVEIEYFK